jgi:hypothetical protein
MNQYYRIGSLADVAKSAFAAVQDKVDSHVREQAGKGAKKSVLPLVLGGAAATVLAVLILRPPPPKL